MQTVGRGIGLGLAGLLVLSAVVGWAQEPTVKGKVDVKVVKFDALAREVLKHKGKVVVVDVWGIT